MKILVLNGSYRTHGNTARALSLIEERMHSEAKRTGETLDLEIINLGHLRIQMCQGCRICFDRGEEYCPLKDDLLAVKAKMKEADGLIVATPVYVNDVNGATKNWIDRLAHVCHRPEFAGKCVCLLATVADGPTSHAMMTLNMALRTWGFHLVGQTGLKTGALMKRDEIEARYMKQIRKIARRLFRAVRDEQSARPSFLSLMTFCIQQRAWQRNADGSVDYVYWKNQGWLEPGRTFYIPHKANWLKVTLARLVGDALAPFVS